ncbi:hypothetical protein GJ744_006702 [Endocarpon pusillum]|uniref:Heterokaryon incompatibility domain-containing protein n=1 Tax=Endocarpon pusillum TaxID=364733 RepID=A0A8H7AJU4_9EURO|nr:hypothetical protein GJ744_006702 [Endocarpon pusillum]
MDLKKDDNVLYDPLPTADSFRFAYLKPGVGQDPIECELVTRTVKEEVDSATPQWEALSWLWGARGDLRAIIVNGRKFSVTRNLFIALNHLRLRERSRLLWVDALCINQDDIEERSSQIKQMAFLFHRAKNVIAWLGGGDAGSQVVMRLARYLHDFDTGNLSYCDANMIYILALTFGVPAVESDPSNSVFNYWKIHRYENWNYIDRIVDRELFRRSWVLQEAALAKSLVVTCGTETISWDAFFRAVSLRFSTDRRARDYPTVHQGWSAMQAIENLRQLVATKQRPPDLLELLWACRDYKSTDPRDRIFALLGVSDLLYGHGPSQQLGFEIDYSKPIHDVFASFAMSTIGKYGDLRVLATRRSNRAFDSNYLGSWCPDWASLDDGVSLLYRQHQWSGNIIKYRACGDLSFAWLAAGKTPSMGVLEMGHLILRGFILDRIAALRHTSHFIIESDRLFDWHNWAVWPDQREQARFTQPKDQADPQRQDAFWRTVIADADVNGNRQPVYLRAQFHRWYQKVIESSNTVNDSTVGTLAGIEGKDFLTRMRHVTRGRCLFETSEHGLLGIGDKDYSAELGGEQLRPGDLIAIVHGGPLPVMLRAFDGPLQKGAKRTYELIGDAFCYVHGMVDGEALRLGTKMEDFTIV